MAETDDIRIRDVERTATKADLTSNNYLVLDCPDGLKKVPGNLMEPESPTISDVTGLQEALDSKATTTDLAYTDSAESHKFVTSVNESNGVISVTRSQPGISDVSGLQDALDSKATSSDITTAVNGLKGINFYASGSSTAFATYSPSGESDVDVTLPSSAGGIVYLPWDGETNIYNTIKEHRDAGETVFITTPEGYTGIPMDDNPDGGRVCFMHMPASSVLIYTEFYAGGTPGFSQTTQGITTVLNLSGSNYEYIWNSLNQVNGGCSFYTDENKNRYIFHHYTTESAVRSYYMYSLDPLSTIPIYVFKRSGSEGSYTYTRAKVTTNGLPVIIYAPTSSDLNNTKQNRVAICRLDKNHSDDGLHTDNYCEFLIQLHTGSTPNGNANSSLSLHVLASALEDGGPYNVDMRITANNNWDLDNARPTIATADTGTGNDGVIVFFGLFNRSNTAWVDFEQTNVAIVVLNPTPKLLGNTDKVDSLNGLVIHSLSPDNLPSVSAGNVNDCLCIGNDSSGTSKLLRWKPNSADIGLLTKETVTITESTYQSLRIDRGKWYDVKISGNYVPELWLIGNSSDTIHTIVKLSRTSSSNSGVVQLDYWDERLEEHWIDCDLSNGKYYEFDVTIKDRYWDPISGQYVSLARVWRIVDDI